MAADSSAFRDWAVSCEVVRGLKNITQPDSGYASSGNAVYATGKADAPLTISLGDSGYATLQFSAPFYNGPGPDFAVFENGFGSGEESFLELAFVSVSSDGVHFFRFPAFSEHQSSTQMGTFENSDASLFHNLAGKYIAGYGVPFDLDDITDTSLLDKSSITHVRVLDVVGSIDSTYASFDSEGHIINDPWPTAFDQGGFDLDAVGIIHSTIPVHIQELEALQNLEDSGPCLDLTGRVIPCRDATGIILQKRGGVYVKTYGQAW